MNIKAGFPTGRPFDFARAQNHFSQLPLTASNEDPVDQLELAGPETPRQLDGPEALRRLAALLRTRRQSSKGTSGQEQARPAPRPDAGLSSDGARIALASRKPDRSGRPPVLFVNGILTGADKASAQAQRLSDGLGRNVTLVHNASGGLVKDAAELVADHSGLGNNPAVVTLKEELNRRLDADKLPIELVGYSQGAQISARALREVRQERIEAATRAGASRKTAEESVDREISKRVKFLNVSGAAQRSDFPSALKSYRQVSLDGDPVSQLLGEQSGGYDRSEFAKRALKIPRLMVHSLEKHDFFKVLEQNERTLLDFKA